MAEDGRPTREEIDGQLRQARQAIEDARGASDASLSDALVVNRCYYACFHAAQAVLYDNGKAPSSHGGVLSLFGSEIVKPGDVKRERGRFLNRLSELRRRADYGYKPIEENVDELLDDAEAFVEEMESLVGEA